MSIDLDPLRCILSIIVPIWLAVTDHCGAAVVSMVVIGFIDRAIYSRRISRCERRLEIDPGQDGEP